MEEHNMVINRKILYVVNKLKDENCKITEYNIHQMVIKGMLIMRKFKKTAGITKREILITSMKELIEDNNCPDKGYLLTLVKRTLPYIINTIVWVGKQKLNFNPKHNKLCCLSPEYKEPDEREREKNKT